MAYKHPPTNDKPKTHLRIRRRPHIHIRSSLSTVYQLRSTPDRASDAGYTPCRSSMDENLRRRRRTSMNEVSLYANCDLLEKHR